jgi:hypothetical protein
VPDFQNVKLLVPGKSGKNTKRNSTTSTEDEDSDYEPEGEPFIENEDMQDPQGRVNPTLLAKRDTPQWEENYNRLLQYWQDHGHIKVKKKSDPKLAQWIVNQVIFRDNQC